MDITLHTTNLQQFRYTLYQNFNNRADTLLDLLDAICSKPDAQSVVEYSLAASYRRSYSTIFKALDELQLAALWLPQRLAPYLPRPTQRPFWLLLTDVTPCPRPFAHTLENRGMVYQPEVVDSSYSKPRYLHAQRQFPHLVTIARVRGTRTFYQQPFTLVRIVRYDQAGKALFKHPLWLILMGARRHELTLVHIYQAYAARFDIEAPTVYPSPSLTALPSPYSPHRDGRHALGVNGEERCDRVRVVGPAFPHGAPEFERIGDVREYDRCASG